MEHKANLFSQVLIYFASEVLTKSFENILAMKSWTGLQADSLTGLLPSPTFPCLAKTADKVPLRTSQVIVIQVKCHSNTYYAQDRLIIN